MRLVLALLLVMVQGTASSQDHVTVANDSLFAQSTHRFMRFRVLLPRGYNNSDERYVTLYLLHGLTGSYIDWTDRTNLVGEAEHYRFLIVMPDAGNSWYANAPGVKNEAYEDYVIRDLVPFVEAKYRTLSTRHGRAIAGLSMGGYGALKFALKYPSRFFCAGSFSGTVYMPDREGGRDGLLGESAQHAFGDTSDIRRERNDLFVLAATAPPHTLPYFYLSIGAEDEIAGNVDANRALTALFRERHCSYEYHEHPGGHNWKTWDTAIAGFLRVVLAQTGNRQ